MNIDRLKSSSLQNGSEGCGKTLKQNTHMLYKNMISVFVNVCTTSASMSKSSTRTSSSKRMAMYSHIVISLLAGPFKFLAMYINRFCLIQILN